MKHLKKYNKYNESTMISDDTDILDPKFTDKNAEEFMERLGVRITRSENGQNVFIRKSMNNILYSFVSEEDCAAFKEYVIKNNIDIFKELTSEGARYPYQIMLKKN